MWTSTLFISFGDDKVAIFYFLTEDLDGVSDSFSSQRSERGMDDRSTRSVTILFFVILSKSTLFFTSTLLSHDISLYRKYVANPVII